MLCSKNPATRYHARAAHAAHAAHAAPHNTTHSTRSTRSTRSTTQHHTQHTQHHTQHTQHTTTKNKWSTHEHSHPHPATQRARSGFGCTPRACTSTHPASTRPTRRSEVRSECDARAQRVARKDGGGEAVVPFLSVSIK